MIKLVHLLKEYQKEYLDVLLDKISAQGIKSLTPDEKKFLKSYSKAEKPYQAKNVFIPFDYVKIGDLAKFKKDREAEYKIVNKFYGSEYDEIGAKYDTVSTLGFGVDSKSDIAKKQGDMFGGKGEIASFRDALKNPSPVMMSDEKFDDIEFVVAQTPNMSQPRIYRYAYPGHLYVPGEN